MTAREQARMIAESVRHSLLLAVENGMTIEQFLANGGDRVIGNNAAQVIAAEEVE